MSRAYGAILSILTVLSLSLESVSPAWAVSLEMSLPDIQAKASETIKAPIKVKDAAGVGSVQMDLVFDPKVVEVMAVEAGGLLSNGMVEFNVSQDRCKIAFVSSDPVTGAGDLLTMTLRLRDDPGVKSPLIAQNVQAWENENLQPMNVTVAEGKVRVEGQAGGLPGLVGYALYTFGIFAAGALGWMARGRFRFGTAPVGQGAGTCPKCGDRIINYCTCCGARIHN
jgi:hypothetical protein